jgi:hypothetical protein
MHEPDKPKFLLIILGLTFRNKTFTTSESCEMLNTLDLPGSLTARQLPLQAFPAVGKVGALIRR